MAEIKNRTRISIIKTLPISSADDFKAMEDFEPMADRFLFDSKTPEGVPRDRSRLYCPIPERPGPTGLLVTTTALSIEPELETRLFSIPIADSPEQTGAVLRALAARDIGGGGQSAIEVAP